MINFFTELSNSIKYGLYSDDEINNVISMFEKQLDVVLKYDETSWIELYDKDDTELIVLMHRAYKIAFVKSSRLLNCNQIYIKYVKSFSEQIWYIDDFEKFTDQFPYIHWDEPKHVVDPEKFNLLDMRFATE